MQRRKLAKRVWILLLIAACAAYFYKLGAVPLLGADEPRYAQVAREMFVRRDFVTPTLGSHTWFEKPALLYWLMMGSYALVGVTELAARLPAALSGLLVLLLVGWTARRVELEAGERARWLGIACAAVLASSVGMLSFSRGASFDILLTLTVTLALSSFFVAEFEEDSRRRRVLLAGFYAGVGLSLLAKGLVGIVLPAGVVLVYLLLRRRWPSPLKLGAWWGVPLALALAAVWYLPVSARHGWQFVDEFFVQHHFARYVSNKYNHPQPFYYYLPTMIWLALPWTLFVVGGIGKFWRRDFRAEEPEERLRVFALAWLVVPVVFFSLSGSKLPGYVLPALPGACILASLCVARFVRGEGGASLMRATGAGAVFLGVAALVYGYTTGALELACVAAISAPVLAAGVVALVLVERRALCVAALTGATLLSAVLVVECALDSFVHRESVRELIGRAEAEGYSTTLPVYQLHDLERTAEFYAAGRIPYQADGKPVKFEGVAEIAEALRARGGGGALVLVPLEFLPQVTGAAQMDARVIGDNGMNALVYVRLK